MINAFKTFNENITIVRGDTLAFGIELYDVENETDALVNLLDQDLTSCCFSVSKDYENKDNIFQKSLDDGISKVATGKYRVRIAPEDTAGLAVGNYYYDLEIGLNGDYFTILKGLFEVEYDLTKSSGGSGGGDNTQEKTVALALSSGNQEVFPDAGYSLGKVTILKPSTLIPDNIKDGITIAGVRGTYGGQNATEPYIEYTITNNKTDSVKLYGFSVVPGGLCAFYSDMTAVDFSESPNIREIAPMAFYNNDVLYLTSLPNSIEVIGELAFANCFALALASLPNSLRVLGNSVFNACANLAITALPNGIEEIGNSAFIACSNIIISELPSSLTKLGNQVFYGCTNISISKLPQTITTIGQGIFTDCIQLDKMEIACNLTGERIFRNCSGLKKVWIRNTCTQIVASGGSGRSPFVGCADDLTIYLEGGSVPAGFEQYWNCTGASGLITANVVYNQTTRPW